MSAPREVTPAEALPSALVRKAQASGAGELPRATGCQGQQQLGYQPLLASAGMGRDETAELGRVARPPNLWPSPWKGSSQNHLSLHRNFLCLSTPLSKSSGIWSRSWHSLHGPNSTPASVPGRAALQKLLLAVHDE